MNKIILSILCLFSLLFFGCSKGHKITNLSGVDWYDASICYYTDNDSDEIARYEDIGKVEIGKDCYVNKKHEKYFRILAKDINGNSVGSDILFFFQVSNTVARKDIMKW